MYQLFQDNYEDFVTLVSDVYDEITTNDEYNTVAIIAKYDEAKEIIRELCNFGHYIGNVYGDFNSKKICGYSDEYIITIFENEVSIEQAKLGKEYLCVETECVFILSNCNSKILSKIFSEISTFEVTIGEEDDDCGCCCEDCEDDYNTDCEALALLSKQNKQKNKCGELKDNKSGNCKNDKHDDNKDTKLVNHNKYEEDYFVNGNSVSKEEYEKAVNDFSKKYLNNLLEMLNDYNDFYDEMDRFSKLFRW